MAASPRHENECQPSNPVESRPPGLADGDDTVDSRELFRGRRELQISHEGEVYRLRVTRNGRLILNK